MEQVEIVEKKAASLQEPENPLDVENMDSCEHLGPEDRQALEYVIANSLNSLKKTLCEAVESWNNRCVTLSLLDIDNNHLPKISPFTLHF